MSASNPEPLEVLVVGWFPSADDTSAGRFVADQVAALAATGMVRPSVIAFENAALRGAPVLRDRQAAAVAADGEHALRAGSPFNPRGAAGPPGVPLARLTVAAGETGTDHPDHRAIHRLAAVTALLDRTRPAPVGPAPCARWLSRRAPPPRWPRPGWGLPLVITEHASFLASLLADPLVRQRYLDAARIAAGSSP